MPRHSGISLYIGEESTPRVRSWPEAREEMRTQITKVAIIADLRPTVPMLLQIDKYRFVGKGSTISDVCRAILEMFEIVDYLPTDDELDEVTHV
jgi:hypothetical protein